MERSVVLLLDNPVREYAWGSLTVVPELLGRAPSGRPQAELWVGAHPGAPSQVPAEARSLADHIAADPVAALGAAVVERFGPTLPFLLKVLAVEKPLSIQVHPTREQAAEGFAAENAAGVPLDAPQRCYRDANHKPEMVVALTEFEALVGFREPAATAELLAAFGVPELDAAARRLAAPDGLRSLTQAWLELSDASAKELVAAVASTLEAGVVVDDVTAGLLRRLLAEYPGDRGILIALLLRHRRLLPGEAVFVAAGVPHAYLSGVAVEPQASSDNTLRAGLTPKHVDTAEVARLLDYEPNGGLSVPAIPTGPGVLAYPVPGMAEFLLTRVEPAAPVTVGAGTRLVLVVSGELTVSTATSEVVVGRGGAAFVPAAAGAATLAGNAVAYTVTTALDAAG